MKIDIGNRIMETVAWCNSRGCDSNTRYGLRSRDLLQELPFSDIEAIVNDSLEDVDLKKCCEMIANVRRRFVQQEYSECKAELSRHSHFILYDRSASFLTGLAQRDSDGYFSVEDCPPWDTWIYYGAFRGCIDARGNKVSDPVVGLLSLVPDRFLTCVRRGIAADVGFAVSWVKDPCMSML